LNRIKLGSLSVSGKTPSCPDAAYPPFQYEVIYRIPLKKLGNVVAATTILLVVIILFMHLSLQFGGKLSAAQRRDFAKSPHSEVGKFVNIELDVPICTPRTGVPCHCPTKRVSYDKVVEKIQLIYYESNHHRIERNGR
jgi:hypothetical protein